MPDSWPLSQCIINSLWSRTQPPLRKTVNLLVCRRNWCITCTYTHVHTHTMYKLTNSESGLYTWYILYGDTHCAMWHTIVYALLFMMSQLIIFTYTAYTQLVYLRMMHSQSNTVWSYIHRIWQVIESTCKEMLIIMYMYHWDGWDDTTSSDDLSFVFNVTVCPTTTLC